MGNPIIIVSRVVIAIRGSSYSCLEGGDGQRRRAGRVVGLGGARIGGRERPLLLLLLVMMIMMMTCSQSLARGRS